MLWPDGRALRFAVSFPADSVHSSSTLLSICRLVQTFWMLASGRGIRDPYHFNMLSGSPLDFNSPQSSLRRKQDSNRPLPVVISSLPILHQISNLSMDAIAAAMDEKHQNQRRHWEAMW